MSQNLENHLNQTDLDSINNFLKILMSDRDLKKKYSLNAREYAVKNFNIEKISAQFENLINNLDINK